MPKIEMKTRQEIQAVRDEIPIGEVILIQIARLITGQIELAFADACLRKFLATKKSAR